MTGEIVDEFNFFFLFIYCKLLNLFNEKAMFCIIVVLFSL